MSQTASRGGLFDTPAGMPFNAAPMAPQTDLASESDGGVVCELRRVWREMDTIGRSIANGWPDSNAKAARLARNKWAMDVIAEAGKRLKARICQTADAPGEEGF